MCLSYHLTFCANCANGLLRAEIAAELVAAVVVNLPDDFCLFDPSLKRCDANRDGLDSMISLPGGVFSGLLDATRKLLLTKSAWSDRPRMLGRWNLCLISNSRVTFRLWIATPTCLIHLACTLSRSGVNVDYPHVVWVQRWCSHVPRWPGISGCIILVTLRIVWFRWWRVVRTMLDVLAVVHVALDELVVCILDIICPAWVGCHR